MTSRKNFFASLILLLFLSSCLKTNPPAAPPTQTVTFTATQTITPSPSPTATLTPTPQPRLKPASYGPEMEEIPAGYNPLTGRAVQDPSLLELPAVLVSISNMPVTARPQAGPGFAPWIFEYYIGEATTRFLGVFYGDYPRRVPNATGGCDVRETISKPTGAWLGNRVWLDENEDGIQNDWELGVGGVCVHLYANENLIASTSTNSNGYYAFDLPDTDANYQLEFEKSDAYAFTQPNTGNDDQDSDADTESGRTRPFNANAADSSWDVGLILIEDVRPTPSPVVTGTPPSWYLPLDAYVGPIRSGRLTYDHVNKMFTNSCLVFASAAADILAQLEPCELIFGVDLYDPNSATLTIEHMRELAEESLIAHQPVNYAGHLFDEELPPLESQPANSIAIFYHQYSQSGWEYDLISESYLRYTDNADGTGKLHPASDRLTGRQQSFENVIVLQATHDVFRRNQLDIDLSMSQRGFAWLFRDGQVMRVYWSTKNRAWEQKNGLRRPIHFEDIDGNPIALHPGRTWIHLMTPASYLDEVESGVWRVKFVQPNDAPID
jgi:hypothetical protein